MEVGGPRLCYWRIKLVQKTRLGHMYQELQSYELMFSGYRDVGVVQKHPKGLDHHEALYVSKADQIDRAMWLQVLLHINVELYSYIKYRTHDDRCQCLLCLTK